MWSQGPLCWGAGPRKAPGERLRFEESEQSPSSKGVTLNGQPRCWTSLVPKACGEDKRCGSTAKTRRAKHQWWRKSVEMTSAKPSRNIVRKNSQAYAQQMKRNNNISERLESPGQQISCNVAVWSQCKWRWVKRLRYLLKARMKLNDTFESDWIKCSMLFCVVGKHTSTIA